MDETEAIRRRLEREKAARLAAEEIAESRTRELWESNQSLNQLNAKLQELVDERTSALVSARDEALLAKQAMREVLATVSHEIRTPMNAILGMTELALASTTSSDLRQLLRRVVVNGESLLEIVDDVLDVSRAESGRLEFENETFTPLELAENVASFLSVRAEQKGLFLIADLDPNLATPVSGPPKRVRQILVNLLGNAVKFSTTGDVVLRGRRDGDTLEFTVIDQGIGIPKDQREAIFEPYVRASDASKGTGLGLSIVRHLIDHLQGSIELKSELGKGTTFVVRIPAATSDEAPLDKHLIAGRLEGVRVSVREPHAVRRSALESLLKTAGATLVADSDEPQVRLLADGLDDDGSATATVVWMNSTFEKYGKKQSEFAVLQPIRKGRWIAELERALGRDVRASLSPRPSATPAPMTSSASVLVVEDDLDSRAVLTRLLGRFGCEVHEARDGKEALRVLQRHSIDLVLSDLQMPGMDGYQLIREIRSQNRFLNLPVVALSAHSATGHRERCLQIGMSDFLSKPVRGRDVQRLIRRWVPEDSGPSKPGPEDPAAVVRVESDVADLVPAFLDRRRSDVDAITNALVEADFSAIQDIGHRMKGSGSAFGFGQISELGAKLEDAAKIQRRDVIESVVVALDRFLCAVVIQTESGREIG